MTPLPPSRKMSDCARCEYRSLRMFCNLTDSALLDFESIGTPARHPNGTILFREGEKSRGVIVVCTGQIKLSCTSKDGKTLILKIAMPGDVLGLGAVISGSPYEVAAETIEPTQIKSIGGAEFLRFLEKTRRSQPACSQSSLRGVQGSILRCSPIGPFPVRPAAGWRGCCSIGAAQQRAANPRCVSPWLSRMKRLQAWPVPSRETVTRMLSRFKKDGLIQVTGSSILILDPKRLEHITA